jgi:hypothetical protein
LSERASHGRWDRRSFVGTLAAAAGGVSLGLQASAQERSVVVLARADNLKSIFGTPHYEHILELLTAGLRELTGEITDGAARRRYFGINDRLAVQIAVSPVPVVLEVVDAVCTTAARAGVPVERMFIYSADEHELYRAGFAIKHEGPGVRCFGARSEGYRGSISKLISPELTAIANVPCLAPHPQAGLSGAIQNYVNSVTNALAQESYEDQAARLPAILKERAFRERTRLHVMDCLKPAYDLSAEGPPTRWEYNGLLLSTDPVALDTVALSILQAKRREVAGRDWPLDPYPTYIDRAAEQYGLGVADLAQIDLRRVGTMDGALI